MSLEISADAPMKGGVDGSAGSTERVSRSVITHILPVYCLAVVQSVPPGL